MSSGTLPLEVKISLIDEVSKDLAKINAAIQGVVAPAQNAARKLAKFGEELGVNKLGKALGSVKKEFGGVAKEMVSLGKDLAWVAAGVGAAAGGLFAIAKRSADNADLLESQAKSLGVTVQSWESLAGAAGLAGSSADTLHRGLDTLNKSITATARGNQEMASAFEYAGVSIKDENGKIKTADAVFMELTDTFNKMEDGPKKAALAMKLMGSAGSDLLPMLDKGSAAIDHYRQRAVQLKGSWSQEQLDNAATFKNALDELGMALGGISDAIGKKLHPILEPCIRQVTDMAVKFREWIESSDDLDQKIQEVVDQVCVFCGGLGETWESVKAFALEIDAIVQKFGGWQTVLGYVASALAALKIAPLVASLLSLGGAILSVGWAAGGVALRGFLLLGTSLGKVIGFLSSNFMPALGAAKSAIVFLAKTFSGILVKGAGLALAALKGLFAFLMANPIVLIIAAIAAAAYLIYKHWDSIGPWLAELWESIKNIFNAAWEWIASAADSAWAAIVATIKSIFDPVVAYFGERIDAVKSAFDVGIIAGIKAVFDNFHPVRWIVDAMDALTQYLFGFSLKEEAERLVDSLWNGLKSFWDDTVAPFFLGLDAVFRDWFGFSLLDMGKDIIGGLWNGSKSYWDDMVAPFFLGLDAVFRDWFGFSLIDKGEEIVNSLWDGLKGAWQGVAKWFADIKDTIAGVWDSITGIFGGASEEAKKADEAWRDQTLAQLDEEQGRLDEAAAIEKALWSGEPLPPAREAMPKAADAMRESVRQQEAVRQSGMDITIENRTGNTVAAAPYGPGINSVTVDNPYQGPRGLTLGG